MAISPREISFYFEIGTCSKHRSEKQNYIFSEDQIWWSSFNQKVKKVNEKKSEIKICYYGKDRKKCACRRKTNQILNEVFFKLSFFARFAFKHFLLKILFTRKHSHECHEKCCVVSKMSYPIHHFTQCHRIKSRFLEDRFTECQYTAYY